MKRLTVIFVILFGTLLLVWGIKMRHPVNAPDAAIESNGWASIQSVSVSNDWSLDPEIPLNYIPVPGEDELYMVVDNDGRITGYRKRTRQIDGSWVWEDVNPDIPEDYLPVEGLDNVYMVTDAGGNISYVKYIRNDDDTYAFVDVDENGNILNRNTDASVIDDRHVHVTGNVYKLMDSNGVMIGYDKRVKTEDGSFVWMDTAIPEPGNINDKADEYKITGEGMPGYTVNRDTSEMNRAAAEMQKANDDAAKGSQTTINVNITNPPAQIRQGGNVPIQVINNSDGTHTETEIYKETRRVDGTTTTYETYIKKTYDDQGNLIRTESDGPYESTTTQDLAQNYGPLSGGSTSLETTIEAEASRVLSSYDFNTDLSNSIFVKLNAQRVSSGSSILQTSSEAMQIAKLRAADMAANDTSVSPLPTYGTLSDMLATYNIEGTASENLWKTVEMDAEDIHTRFQAVDESRNIRTGSAYSRYGVAVSRANGYLYICEIFLQ